MAAQSTDLTVADDTSGSIAPRGRRRKSAPANSRNGTPADPAAANWARYQYVKSRGHPEYCVRALRLEDYYLGGGRQWSEDDRAYMESVQGCKAIELNEIFDAINTAAGYQINNRLDISFQPRGLGASEQVATTMSKVVMQIADNNRLPWHESQVFMDGIVQERGYYELRVRFDDTLLGEADIDTLDPLDVIPDPDAKSYDPDDWGDVIITRWWTLEDIEANHGSEVANEVRRAYPNLFDRDFGDDPYEVERNKFGDPDIGIGENYDAYYSDGGIARVRIIDRQYWRMVMTLVAVYPTGDIRIIENASPEQIDAFNKAGCVIMRRMTKRVRWTVSTRDLVLFDDWSPFKHFTVVPFFPFFRRGKTSGLVNNAIGPQDLLNKAVTKQLHIVSSMANSGWIVQQQSLTNMRTDDLQVSGGANGLVIEYRRGMEAPKKIESNQIPTGIDNLARIGSDKIKGIIGITDAMRGQSGRNQSGLAVQASQYGAQMSLGVPLDNLSRTRNMLASRLLEIVQDFYDDPRIFRITKTEPNSGRRVTEDLHLNWTQEDGNVLNDLTVGEYDVVITEQPAQVTFENSQFNQAIEMRKAGINIPDPVLIRYSTLNDKAEIIEQLQNQNNTNPVDEAKAILLRAQAVATQAKAVQTDIQSLFSSTRTAQIISAVPQVAGMADTIARSAGFVDKDGGTIYPDATQVALAGPPAPPPPDNTNPATTDHADRGAAAGIESGKIQS